MIPLADDENKSYKNQKVCYICKIEFSTDDDNKMYHKVRGSLSLLERLEDLLIVFTI